MSLVQFFLIAIEVINNIIPQINQFWLLPLTIATAAARGALFP